MDRTARAATAAAAADALLRPLTADEQAAVDDILRADTAGQHSMEDVVCQVETDFVTRRNMQTLRPGCVSCCYYHWIVVLDVVVVVVVVLCGQLLLVVDIIGLQNRWMVMLSHTVGL